MRFMRSCLPLVLAYLALSAGSARAQSEPSCLRNRPISAEQKALLDEVNLLRSQPQRYAERVRAEFSSLGSDGIYLSEGIRIRTEEGRRAVDEALAFLERAQPVPPLRHVSCLSMAAQAHAEEQGPTGEIGHRSRDGSGPSERAGRLLKGKASCGENIDYGHRSARGAVIALVVDDGVPSRGHRTNLFNSSYISVGFGTGPHSRYRYMVVQLLCMHDVSEWDEPSK
jgi:uncharacterized protein YkwD